MATVEIELRPYKRSNGLQPLVLRITSGSKVSRKNTGLYIQEKEWDGDKHRVNRKHPQWAALNDALDALCKDAEGVKAEIIKDRQLVTPKAVLKRVFAVHDFYEAVDKHRRSFSNEQYGSDINYGKMVTRLKEFAPSLAIEEITPDFLEAFKQHLKSKARKGKGYAHNTIVGTLTKMKAVLNSTDLKGANPFAKVVIGGYKAAKVVPLDMDDIRKIRNYIPHGKWEQIAKDTFLFSFYAAGMRSADVLQLTWPEVLNGRIIYDQNKKRHTDKAELSIPLNAVTLEILSRYDKSKETVFDLVTMSGGAKPAAKERESVQAAICAALKMIAYRCGITKEINFKLARTTFSRIANEMSGRNVYGIQQAMGHAKIATTEIYLGNDNRAVDELLQVVYG